MGTQKLRGGGGQWYVTRLYKNTDYIVISKGIKSMIGQTVAWQQEVKKDMTKDINYFGM